MLRWLTPTVEKAHATGSVPPEMRQLWNRLRAWVQLFDRGSAGAGEQSMHDRVLQLRMLEDALDYNGGPRYPVLLTGDGAGYQEGAGSHRTLERMQGARLRRVEIMSWAHSCNQRMRRCKPSPSGVFLEGIWSRQAWRVSPWTSLRATVTRHMLLCQAVQRWGRAGGCTELASDALIDNTVSHSMHRGLGFEETERVVYFTKSL